jgi:hypothetical protein
MALVFAIDELAGAGRSAAESLHVRLIEFHNLSPTTEMRMSAEKSVMGPSIDLSVEGKISFLENGNTEAIDLGINQETQENYKNISEMTPKDFNALMTKIPDNVAADINNHLKKNPTALADIETKQQALNKSLNVSKADLGAAAEFNDALKTPEPGPNATPAEVKTYWETITNAADVVGKFIVNSINRLLQLIKDNKESIKFIGKLFLIKYLTETTLNSMLAGSNGCWVVDAATGNQVFQINTDKDANKCKCEVDSGTTHTGSIYQQCQIQCRNVSGSAQNYGGCLGTSCNCKDTTGVITPQNYTVKVVNDNCYTMFAKVLSATGLMVSDFVGGVADGFYNITDAFKSVFSKWWILAIVGGIILVIVVIVYLVMYFKSKKNNARQQGGPNITVVSSAPPPSAPPPSFDVFADRPRA